MRCECVSSAITRKNHEVWTALIRGVNVINACVAFSAIWMLLSREGLTEASFKILQMESQMQKFYILIKQGH